MLANVFSASSGKQKHKHPPRGRVLRVDGGRDHLVELGGGDAALALVVDLQREVEDAVRRSA